MDAADRLYVGNPGHGRGRVIDPHGVPLYRIRKTVGRMTSTCTLTPDERSVATTGSESKNSSILIAELPAP
jgi:hypothetical protein